MPEPCKFLSLGGCQNSFLQANRVVDIAPHPVVGLVLHAGDVVKFSLALSLKSLDPQYN